MVQIAIAVSASTEMQARTRNETRHMAKTRRTHTLSGRLFYD